MSEETPAILTDPLMNPSSDPNASRLALGAALRTARKKLDLSIDDAAHQLRMSTRQVLALEEDNFAALTSPAFVRGFIRNYARLLKLDPEPLLQAYRAAQPSQNAQANISLQSEHIAISDGSKKTWLLYVLASFLVVVLGSGWLLYKDWGAPSPKKTAAAETPQNDNPSTPVQQPAPVEPPQTAPVQPVEVVPATPAAAEPTQAVPVAPPVTGLAVTTAPAASVAPVATPATPVVTPTTEKPVVVAKGPIRMVFSEQTWVSVVDSTGKEVFNKNKAAGTEDSADGVPPFKVIIGNVNGTKFFYKDQPYDLAPYTKSNVARLKLE